MLFNLLYIANISQSLCESFSRDSIYIKLCSLRAFARVPVHKRMYEQVVLGTAVKPIT